MGELEELLAKQGIKQWVKNRFVAKMREFSENKDVDIDKFIAQFNAEILVDFKKEVNETVEEVINRASELLGTK